MKIIKKFCSKNGWLFNYFNINIFLKWVACYSVLILYNHIKYYLFIGLKYKILCLIFNNLRYKNTIIRINIY